jgi:hypothetical protein
METKRPRVAFGDDFDDVQSRVQEYARANGLLMPRAYGELIKQSLDEGDAAEGDDEY